MVFPHKQPERSHQQASKLGALLVFLSALAVPAVAAADTPPSGSPRESDLLAQLDTLKLEAGGLFAVISYAGWRDWKWGTAYFRFNSEGWFGMNTGSGGQDKIGHCYSTYLMTEFLFLRLRTAEGRVTGPMLAPPLITWTLMLYVEMFDGFSVDHGFSREDLLMDTLGASTSLFRNAFPAIGRGFDFRLEYYPSAQEGGFHPMIDYSGQKFLLALRPSAVPFLNTTPLRLLELYLGYYTRGFMEHNDPLGKRARLYLGVGIDLEELVTSQLGRARDNPGSPIDYLSSSIRAFQLPYGYPKMTLRARHANR